MRMMALLLVGMFAFAGCLDDDPAPEEATNEDVMEEPMEEETLLDMGEYILDLETNLCHAKDYQELPSGQYQSDFGGGTWVFQESNDVPGLQYEDNHPGSGPGAGFELAVDERCTNGDQTVV